MIEHWHCPKDCEHPQAFERDGKMLCGRCWFVDHVVTEVLPCTPAICEEA